MTRLVIAAAIAITGCHGDPQGAPAARGAGSASVPAPPDAAPVTSWIEPCAAALRAYPTTTPTRRPMALITGCKPYGEWTPLLGWQTLAADGGPRLEAIEAAMTASHAYCSTAGKQAFEGALDEARGSSTERPWRRLADVCGADVSAEAEARFASAPFFVLDRIARAVGSEPTLAPLLADLTLPLPPWSLSGAGVQTPSSPVTKPDIGHVVVTVTQTGYFVGTLATVRFAASGLTVDLGAAPYPGTPATAFTLDAAVTNQLHAGESVAIVAPSGIRAHRIVDAVAATGNSYPVLLAVAAPGGPPGWVLLGTSPVRLMKTLSARATAVPYALHGRCDDVVRAISAATPDSLGAYTPTLAIDADVTAADLAKVLGALAYKNVTAVGLQTVHGRRSP